MHADVFPVVVSLHLKSNFTFRVETSAKTRNTPLLACYSPARVVAVEFIYSFKIKQGRFSFEMYRSQLRSSLVKLVSSLLQLAMRTPTTIVFTFSKKVTMISASNHNFPIPSLTLNFFSTL